MASFSLDGIVADIAVHAFRTGSTRLESGARRSAVEQFLAENRMLLIWEKLRDGALDARPHGGDARAGRDPAQRTSRFVDRLAGGRSVLVITSRATEEWLGDVCRIEVGGLTVDEAIEYAEDLLDPLPHAAIRRTTRSFAGLQEWLGGHPLSMRLDPATS